MLLCIFTHILDFLIAQTRRSCNGYILTPSSSFILGSNLENSVRVDVKCHINLGNAARSRRYPIQGKSTQRLIIVCHRSLTLQDIDLNLRLAVTGGGKDLALACRDRGVALDQSRSNTSQCLDR